LKTIVLATAILFIFPPVAVGQTASGTWSQLSPSGPPARWGHVMIYDPRRDRLLIHGGWNASEFFDDVWEYPLATNGPWHQLTPSGTVPPGRAFHSAIYDPNGDRMIIYGGYQGHALGDVWELDLGGTTLAWQSIATTGTPPPARFWHSAVFNDRYGRMTVFGGEDGATFFDDTPELDLRIGPPAAEWTTPVQPVGPPPPARCCHEAIFYPAYSRLVIFGGWNGSTELGDLWELPYDTFPSPGWTLRLAAGAIGPRTDHVAALDRVRNRLVVHGGVLGVERLGDAWATTLVGAPSWDSLAAAGTPPAPRGDHAAVYDPVRDRLLVYGGREGNPAAPFGDLWALTWGASTAIHVTCSGDTSFTPGDTVFISVDIANPFTAPASFGFTVHGERGWPYSSGGGSIGGFTPIVHLQWGFPVPDTAAGGTNTFGIRVWDEAAPMLADSCTIHLTHMTTSVLLSLVEQHATADEVRLAWYSSDRAEQWELERQEPGSLWRSIATLVPDGTGRIIYVDRAVRPGTRYGYRLKDAGSGAVQSEAWIDVPERSGFALHRAWYASRELWLDVSRASGEDRARVEFIDSGGRRVLTRVLTIDDTRQLLSVPCRVPPGVYFARLTQGARSASGKVLVLE